MQRKHIINGSHEFIYLIVCLSDALINAHQKRMEDYYPILCGVLMNDEQCNRNLNTDEQRKKS